MKMSAQKGSMMLLMVLVAGIATISVEARIMQQQQQHQQQQQYQNEELQPAHDSRDWRPHLPASFRTGFSRPIDHGPVFEESPIVLTVEEASLTPVKNEKKKSYIQNKSEKEPSQQHPSRNKRFILPKQKLRVVAVPISIFNFLGFLPVRIPGLPFHYDHPSPDLLPYRTTHEVPLRVKRRRGIFENY